MMGFKDEYSSACVSREVFANQPHLSSLCGSAEECGDICVNSSIQANNNHDNDPRPTPTTIPLLVAMTTASSLDPKYISIPFPFFISLYVVINKGSSECHGDIFLFVKGADVQLP